MRIDVNLCTFRRSNVVCTLRSIGKLDIPDGVDLGVIVVDNDYEPSAEGRVRKVASELTVPCRYIHSPAANISLARNAGLEVSDADWIVFLDDDETVPANWLNALITHQVSTNADVVFGHSKALYGNDAPAWIVARDYHSNIIQARNGVVETGYTCNALLRWRGSAWATERFSLDRGRSGGEDTEFFFRLRAIGARFEIANDAVVYESIEPDRLTFKWLRQRKVRMGQSYACSAGTLAKKIILLMTAGTKSLYCFTRATLALGNQEVRNYWFLRGFLHIGVCGGCLSLPSRELYGRL